MAIESRAPLAILTSARASGIGRSMRRATIIPASIPASIAALAVVAVSSGVVVPLSVVCLILSAAVLGLLAVKSGAAPLRRALVESAIRRALYARRGARERALAPASFGRLMLAELTRLVDEIERLDPGLADRVDAESLLDRYAALARAHERASRAVSMADRLQLERIRDNYRSDPDANLKRLELCERRLRCQQQCEAKADWLADEIAIVADFIRLVAQRATCPDDPLSNDSIERRLAEFEADDEARRQLAAEFR